MEKNISKKSLCYPNVTYKHSKKSYNGRDKQKAAMVIKFIYKFDKNVSIRYMEYFDDELALYVAKCYS